MIEITLKELAEKYPIPYKQDVENPNLIVFINGILYNQKTKRVIGIINPDNYIKSSYGSAHRLVMRNFGTPAPEGMEKPEVDHIDDFDYVDDIYGHHKNNHINNLQWKSGLDNRRKSINRLDRENRFSTIISHGKKTKESFLYVKEYDYYFANLVAFAKWIDLNPKCVRDYFVGRRHSFRGEKLTLSYVKKSDFYADDSKISKTIYTKANIPERTGRASN